MAAIGAIIGRSQSNVRNVTTGWVRYTGGGRNDEFDLYSRPGGYVRLMDSRAVGRPCPACGTAIEKIRYLGGACYLCPRCQT